MLAVITNLNLKNLTMKIEVFYCIDIICRIPKNCLILVTSILSLTAAAQVNFPDEVVEGLTLSSGNHVYCSPMCLISPSTSSSPVLITQSATVEYDAAICVELNPGFEVSGLTTAGYFVTNGTNSDIDVVVIEPAVNPIEVGQFEKLELGIKLPDYINNAIDNFFTNAIPLNPKINPYDPDQIDVHAVFNYGNFQEQYIVNGFFYREYQVNTTLNQWDEITASPYSWTQYPWRIRFAPPTIGDWKQCGIIVDVHNIFPNIGYTS